MTSTLRITVLAAAAALAGAAASCARATGTASSATPSFTAAQAEAGDQAYQAACLRCHSDPSGGGNAPALAGPAFARRWNGHPVGDLTRFMRDHMPRDFPMLLNDRTYLALVAHLLAENGVPSSGTPLTLESTWTISIESR